ncbi:glycosyltransferase family 4 protein [Aureimonas glaciei]|uniref:Glycosyl transferase n=1 Tax=Aureimonas glaciei TaxID=1776957 RepID=A0A916Y6E1_9HYPH|nr:glycosyltransferase family 4 protein [Aureimonas glaciei]GGD31891.1 glycosyl transferase [Aureimonas glaciei]
MAIQSPPKILISINTSWNVYNFRSGLVQALVAAGYEVVVAAPEDGHSARLADLGCRYIALPMDNQGTSPRSDIRLYRNYRRLMRAEKPDCFLGWTIKPNIYGTLAAQSLGIPAINNISGLGTAFIRGGWLSRLAKSLYRLALRRSATVFFQNRDDRALFVDQKLVQRERTALLPGSGIDLTRFSAAPMNGRPAADLCFLLIGRILWDKGLAEFVAAARQVRARHPKVRFQILGFLDAANQTAVPRSEVDRWVAEEGIDYLGTTDDVRPFIADADCIVLPSYREGTPRTLLEAAALGRPLIATDVPGCREVVDNGSNGLLCAVRDAEDLARCMLEMIAASPAERAEMGAFSRSKVEREFDEQIVIDRYLAAIRLALPSPP